MLSDVTPLEGRALNRLNVGLVDPPVVLAFCAHPRPTLVMMSMNDIPVIAGNASIPTNCMFDSDKYDVMKKIVQDLGKLGQERKQVE